ncbi:MAG: tetratricopeptide repeat protein [Planctomycetaceae bacterium]
MTSRTPWKCFLCALILTGCQSSGPKSWFASREPMYSADELAAMEPPAAPPVGDRHSAASSQVRSAAVATAAAATSEKKSEIQQVSASRPTTGDSQVDTLVRSGQTAIRAAGQGDPGKLYQARALFTEALNIDPSHAAANHGLAIVADLQEDWATAEAHYKAALKARPQDANLLNDLGYSYLLQNRFHEATQYLNQALQISPQHERVHTNLALLALKRGDRAGALNRLQALYSPADAQSTLSRLEQGLNVTATGSGQPSTAVAMNVPGNSSGSPAAGMNLSGMNPAPMNSQHLGQLGQMANTTNPADDRPVHVFPPGVQLIDQAEEAVPQNFGFPEQVAQQNMMPAPAGTPSISGISSGQPQMNLHPAVNSQPLSVPGSMNGQFYGQSVGQQQGMNFAAQSAHPGNVASQQPYPQPRGVMSEQPISVMPTNSSAPSLNTAMAERQAPVVGLNVGPGSLFPIETPDATPAQLPPSLNQQVPSLGAGSINSGNPFQQSLSGTANYGSVPGGMPAQESQVQQTLPEIRPQRQIPSAAPAPQPQQQQPYPQMQPQMQILMYPQVQMTSPMMPGQNYQNGMPMQMMNPQGQVPQQMQNPYPQQQPMQQGYQTFPGAMNPQAAGSPQHQSGTQAQPVSLSQPMQGQSIQTQAMPGFPVLPQAAAVQSSAHAANSSSPLAAYEQRLQQLDSQYNQAVQQMDGRSSFAGSTQNR